MVATVLFMNVAIPKLNDSIASCFDVAKQFEIVVIKNGKIISSKSVNCHEGEGFQRVRLLRLHEIHTLICSGIKRFYIDQLSSIGVTVIPNINDSVKNAIHRFISGELTKVSTIKEQIKSDQIVSHDELINWTEKLFKDFGYSILPCPEKDSSLVDLAAQIKCPVCKKEINVAICCGAQIYRADQEIMEFHYITKTRYNARVYVYITDPNIAKSCNEYGITFISPEINYSKKDNKTVIPILQKPVDGHEKAFNVKR